MRSRQNFLILVTALAATGCATGSHRESTRSHVAYPALGAKTIAPPQTQVSLPAEPIDLFAPAATTTSQRRLAQFFPGLGRGTVAHSPASAPTPTPTPGPVASRTLTPAPVEVATVAEGSRPGFFGFRKSRAQHIYTTDARPIVARSAAAPAFLPVALQIPQPRQADRSVTPTSADVPHAAEAPESAIPAERDPISSNPDASDAAATPLGITEPGLAVEPMVAPQSSARAGDPGPAIEAEPEAATPSPTINIGPDREPEPAPKAEAEATQDLPQVDPRERPRLGTPASPPGPTQAEEFRNPEATTNPDSSEEADQPAAQVAQTDARPEPKATQVSQSVADPGNSLGLPRIELPATYSGQGGMAPRGSGQSAPQPPPVLASPQRQVAPQAAAGHQQTPAATVKTWRLPSVRRLVRRVGGMGEFATPPTAAPH